ncbi:MAG: sigma-70 family RNA polymerase sigma factor [Isosphaeraceae bacterium]
MRGGEAFAELVRRHGPMVLATCRALLVRTHDAEDAFQATFLVLALRAGTIGRPELLGPWLHAVAVRVSRKARGRIDRLRRRAGREVTMGPGEPVGSTGRFDLALVRREELEALHQELDRLPECYRVPLVLCDLGGLTHAEAAERLRWPSGSVSVRLVRAGPFFAIA